MYIVTVVEKTLPRAIIGVWNKKNRCGIKRLTSEETRCFGPAAGSVFKNVVKAKSGIW